MAKRPTLSDVGSGFLSATSINTNNTNIEAAFDNTLSRDGSTPNHMDSDIDLNGNGLLNVGSITFSGVGSNIDTALVYGVVKTHLVDTRNEVENTTIDTTPDVIRTGGYSAAGDGGDALYKRVVAEPSHLGKVQSQDGAWWELVGPVKKASSFGFTGDGTTDDTTALNNALASLSHGDTLVIQCGETGSVITGQLSLSDVNNIHLAFGGGPLLMGEQLASVLVVDNCDDLKITNLKTEQNWGGTGPSDDPLHNKSILATNCDRIRIFGVQSRGLSAVRIDQCSDYFILDVNADTEGDPTVHHVEAGDNQGWDYGVHILGCAGTLQNYVVRNFSQDGVKFQVSRIDDLTEGHKAFFLNGLVTGCQNDDALDLFNSGYEIIVDGFIAENNQKGINAKIGDGSGTNGKIIVSNFHIIGGTYNTTTSDPRQTGIVVDVDGFWAHHGTIEDIDGHAIHWNSGAANAWVDHIDINGVNEVVGEFGTGIALRFEGQGDNCGASHINIHNTEISHITVNTGVSPDLSDINGYEATGRGLNWNTTSTKLARLSRINFFNTGITGTQAFRFTSNTAARHELIGATASGFTTSFEDNSTGRLVYDEDVSWAARSGLTAGRPAAGAAVGRVGRQYYDTTLGKPIWDTGAGGWVDATGTSV